MEKKLQAYKKYLKDCLLNGGMTFGQANTICAKYELLANQRPEIAFAAIDNAAKTTSANDPVTALKIIQAELLRLNAEHPGVDVNPVTRLRAKLAKFNENLEKCSVTVDGEDFSTQAQREARVEVPSWAKSCTTYTATAALKRDLGVTVTL